MVRFVAYEGPLGPRIYALKELPGELARHEYRVLRHLDEEGVPVVRRSGSPPSAAPTSIPS